MYIYKITNNINNKVYIGQTVQGNPKMRWYSHCDYARKGKKSYLYDSMRKYGIENFSWELIDKGNDIDDLNEKEQQWLALYQKTNIVYNNRAAGSNKTHSLQSIEKMKESQRKAHARRRAQGLDGGWKRIDGGAMKGKRHTDATKEKMRQTKLKYYGKIL